MEKKINILSKYIKTCEIETKMGAGGAGGQLLSSFHSTADKTARKIIKIN